VRVCTAARRLAACALSLHDALPILPVLRETWRESLPEASDEVIEQLAGRTGTRLRGAGRVVFRGVRAADGEVAARADLYVHDGRSEEHTSELQSRANLVCRLLLENK